MATLAPQTPHASPLNVATRLRENARRWPDKRALYFNADARHHYASKTFRELDEESDRWAHALVAARIGRGTKTLLMVKPSPELFTVLFALFKVGAVPVVVDPGMGLGRMLHAYRTVGADALVGIPAAHVVRVLFPRSFESLRSWVTVGRKLGWTGATLPPPAAFTAPSGPFPIAETRADDLLMINFTTGATGPAKGVEYTHGIADAMIGSIEHEFAHGPDDVALAPLPLFTAFHLLIGATTILPPIDPNRPALADAAAMIATIAQHEVTHMFASPAFLRRVGDYAVEHHHKLPSLRRVIAGGAPVLPSIARRFVGLMAADARLHVTYGATEALPIASIAADELFGDTAAGDAATGAAATGAAAGDAVTGAAATGDAAAGDAVTGAAATGAAATGDAAAGDAVTGAAAAVAAAAGDGAAGRPARDGALRSGNATLADASSPKNGEHAGSLSARSAAGHGSCVGRPLPSLQLRVIRTSDDPITRWSNALLAAPGEVGELTIAGPLVSRRYHESPESNALMKIEDGARSWHRTGDLGRVDGDGRVWFAGRKSQTVHTVRGPQYTAQWEGIFDAHPAVYRSALVGVGPIGAQQPVVCVELQRDQWRNRPAIERQLIALAAANPLTRGARAFLFHRGFPVDIRHNAKIDRGQLAEWAARQLAPPPHALKLIPLAGWLFIIIGLVVPLPSLLRVLWAIDVFLSVVVHGLQLFTALPRGRRAGYSRTQTVAYTFLYGATWWKFLDAGAGPRT